ncbi:MAG: hypothetical protein Q6364_10750 [Candidatus Hermodarchaeota archaeon]|nr:hypothetical protein [Candidatus Hermodarchaeota archaeon]
MKKATYGVTIRLVGVLKITTGIEKVHLDLEGNDTIGTVLTRLVGVHPVLGQELFNKSGEIHKYLNIFVDNQPVLQENLNDIPIQHSTTLTLVMAVGGG